MSKVQPQTNISKTCISCGLLKPLSAFRVYEIEEDEEGDSGQGEPTVIYGSICIACDPSEATAVDYDHQIRRDLVEQNMALQANQQQNQEQKKRQRKEDTRRDLSLEDKANKEETRADLTGDPALRSFFQKSKSQKAAKTQKSVSRLYQAVSGKALSKAKSTKSTQSKATSKTSGLVKAAQSLFKGKETKAQSTTTTQQPTQPKKETTELRGSSAAADKSNKTAQEKMTFKFRQPPSDSTATKAGSNAEFIRPNTRH